MTRCSVVNLAVALLVGCGTPVGDPVTSVYVINDSPNAVFLKTRDERGPQAFTIPRRSEGFTHNFHGEAGRVEAALFDASCAVLLTFEPKLTHVRIDQAGRVELEPDLDDHDFAAAQQFDSVVDPDSMAGICPAGS